LDAIMLGRPDEAAWQEISATGCSLLLDAGVRTADQAQEYASLLTRCAGESSRLVLGLESWEQLSELTRLAGRYVFSLDLKHGRPLARDPAWQGSEPEAIADAVIAQGIQSLILLDLADVGAGQGSSTLPLIRALRSRYPELEIIAGGGVRGAGDLQSLASAGASAALVASALHDGRLTRDDCWG
jgi:phosphoribosylformimino-5-aminoimidazole carboxamide ribotide isomerase